MNCLICNTTLQGKQRKFCSVQCKQKDNNIKHQHYKNQQNKGHKRRKALIDSHGGSCVKCGYSANTAALCFHHLNSEDKLFQLDIRNCSNRSVISLESEASKCALVCSNCHMEIHYPTAHAT